MAFLACKLIVHVWSARLAVCCILLGMWQSSAAARHTNAGEPDELDTERVRHRRQMPSPRGLRINFFLLPSAERPVGLNRTRLDAVLNATRDWAAATLTVEVPSPNPLLLNRPCVRGIVYRQSSQGQYRQYFCFPEPCQNVTSCGPAIPKVPAEHVDKCQRCFVSNSLQRCASDPEDTSRDQPGMEDTDIVIYVLNDCRHVADGRLASGDSCLRFAHTDRPNAGWLAVCGNRFSNDIDALPYQIAEVQREAVRILGVSKREFPYWLQASGMARTTRNPSTNLPMGAGPNNVGSSTLSQASQTLPDGNLRQYYQLSTPSVLAEARRHSACPQLTGVPMEDYNNSFDSFEMRVVGQSELLTVRSFLSSYKLVPVVSRLTLAALEDTGWYMTERNNAFTLNHGAARGCSFVMDNCLDYVNQTLPIVSLLSYPLYNANVTRAFSVTQASWQVDSASLDVNDALPFCNAVRTSVQFARCEPSRRTITACNLANTSLDIAPAGQRYFQTSSVQGVDVVSDNCPTFSSLLRPSSTPVAVPAAGMLGGAFAARCDDLASAPAVNWALEQYSASSLCIEHSRVWERLPKDALAYQQHNADDNAAYYGAGCYRRECLNNGSLRIWIADTGIVCNTAGEVREFAIKANTIPYMGGIICPSPAEFCIDRRCPGNCSWHGDCRLIGGVYTCQCFTGYTSSNCATLADGTALDLVSASSSNPDIGPPVVTYFTPLVIANIAAAATVIFSGIMLLWVTQCIIPARNLRRIKREARNRRNMQSQQAQSAGLLELQRMNSTNRRVQDSTDVIDSTHGAIYPRQPGFHAPRQNNLVQEPSYPRQPVFVPNNMVESGEPREEVIDHGYAPTASENPANNHIQVGAISHTVVEAPMQPLNHMV